jgi:hypothetical protein
MEAGFRRRRPESFVSGQRERREVFENPDPPSREQGSIIMSLIINIDASTALHRSPLAGWRGGEAALDEVQ